MDPLPAGHGPRANEPWFCYMVRCKDDSLYVGVATDVEERIERHNRGFGAMFTAKRRPVTLLWKRQYPDQKAARNRERGIKGWQREKKLELVRQSSREEQR